MTDAASRVAERTALVCLLHEKPFAGVNGSGKHVNFSFGNSTQGNLLDPGDTPHDNAQFLVFCAGVIRAVHKFGAVLRAAIAVGQQRPPSRRERGSARDHLDLPRRAAHRRVRADQGRRRQVVEVGRHARGRRGRAAEAAEGRGRPQPHEPVRLHRQPLRVPRGRLGSVDLGPADRAQHDRRGVARLHRDHARGGGQERQAAERRPSRRCSPTSSRSTARSASTATATPPSGTPRPRSAASRT